MTVRTTRKPTMIKSVAHLYGADLLAMGAKYFNELMNGYGIEFNEVHFDAGKDAWTDSEGHTYSTIDDFCKEVSYWLSCYYESGHSRHEEEYNDRKAFIKFLEVFKPFCNLKHTEWIPYKTETAFLF